LTQITTKYTHLMLIECKKILKKDVILQAKRQVILKREEQ